MNREPLVQIQDSITDSNLRRLARDIQWGRISRSEAIQALSAWKAHTRFDGPERLILELLFDASKELID